MIADGWPTGLKSLHLRLSVARIKISPVPLRTVFHGERELPRHLIHSDNLDVYVVTHLPGASEVSLISSYLVEQTFSDWLNHPWHILVGCTAQEEGEGLTSTR